MIFAIRYKEHLSAFENKHRNNTNCSKYLLENRHSYKVRVLAALEIQRYL